MKWSFSLILGAVELSGSFERSETTESKHHLA